MALIDGIIGQIQGPFSSSTDVITLIKQKEGITDSVIFAKLGISVGEKDYMVYSEDEIVYKDDGTSIEKAISRLYFELKQAAADAVETMWLGKTYIYESDDGIELSSLKFPQGAPASTLIDYTLLVHY